MMIILLRTTIIERKDGGCMDKVIRYITHDEECWLCGGTGELLVGLDDAATCYDCDGKGIVAGTTLKMEEKYNDSKKI